MVPSTAPATYPLHYLTRDEMPRLLSVQRQQAFDFANFAKYVAYHDMDVPIFLHVATCDYRPCLLLQPSELHTDGTHDNTSLQPVLCRFKSLTLTNCGVKE